MEERKCPECGRTVTNAMSCCSYCGYPIGKDKELVPVKKHGIRKKVFLIVPLLIGILLLIMGGTVLSKKPDLAVYEAKTYYTDGTVFGGDFYTEIYKTTDIIVDELNDINTGVAMLTESINYIVEGLYLSTGVILIALGMCSIGMSVLKFV